MKRSNVWLRTRAAIGATAMAVLLINGVAAAQETGGLEISRIDLDAFPAVGFDVAIAANLTDGNVDAQDVTLFENGQPVEVEVAPVPTDGLEVVLLIDTSGSMNERAALASAKLAAVGFLDELPGEVPVGVVGFADTPSLVSPLTTDRTALRAALDQLRAGGKTAMYDGIVFGDTLFSGGTTDRQFVLLSDGGDTASAATFEDALAVTARVRTNAIEIVTSESNSESIAGLAQSGNGRLTSVADPTGLGVLYQDVARSLVNRYRVAFRSQSSGETTYTVEIATLFGPVSGSTVVAVPDAPTPETTRATTPDTMPPVTQRAPVAAAVVIEPSVPETSVVVSTATVAAAGGGSTGSILPLVLGVAAVGLGLTALLVILLAGDSRRAGRRQLGIQKPEAKRGATTSTIGERVTALADDAIDRSGARSGLARALDVADVALRPSEFLVVTLAGAVGVAALFMILGGPILGVIGFVMTPLVARSVLTIRAQRRRQAFEEQLPDVLQLMTNALRSGYALPQALDAVATQAAEPASSEFRRVNFEARVGVDLGDSLRAMSERMESVSFGWVVAALDINREVGGELAKVLTTLATTIRDRQQLDRQIKTLTAEGRISAYVLTALPIIVGLAMALLNPDYFEPLRSSPGSLILLGAVALLGAGWIWMRSMIKAEI
jgi:tight adherence protein B